jgi:hypothetical protein
VDRQVVASAFMSRYPEAPASVEFDSYDDTPYMDQVLDLVARDTRLPLSSWR